MHVVSIGGASTIGSTVAYTLAGADPTIDISRIDIDQDAAWAHATDITHAGYHFANTLSASPRPDTDVLGEIWAVTSDGLSQIDPDLILFNAAAPLSEDATEELARSNSSAISP